MDDGLKNPRSMISQQVWATGSLAALLSPWPNPSVARALVFTTIAYLLT